jgi:hypothetical protein
MAANNVTELGTGKSIQLSEYAGAEKTANVFKDETGTYGAEFFENGTLMGRELYPGKSEAWAEDCAENYVLGVKVLNES